MGNKTKQLQLAQLENLLIAVEVLQDNPYLDASNKIDRIKSEVLKLVGDINRFRKKVKK